MTTIAQFLTQKQKLFERLDEIPDPKERAQIERLFAEVDEDLYQSAEVLTLGGNSQIRGSMIQHGNWRELPWASRLRF